MEGERVLSPLCTDPESFDGLPAWALKGCKDADLFSNAYDAQFSQGYGNYTTIYGTPFRYVNDGHIAKIQLFITKTNKPTRPQHDENGLVQVIDEYVIKVVK